VCVWRSAHSNPKQNKTSAMHIDARTLNDHAVIEGDICIVGAGAAGISMAMDWIGTPYKVILLEGGGFEYDERVQDLYAGKITGQRYYPLKSCRLHYFGGTTGHWSGFCSPLDEVDFMKRDWVEHSGWPIHRKDLDPFYARAHKILELGPYDYELKYWQKQNAKMVPFPFDENVVWNKMWQFSPPTRFGTKYRDTIRNAKNIHLYTYANVVDINANENISSINSVTAKNYTGKQYTVKAKHFVIACCSIQNARLLLAANKQSPKGLGNDNDQVGRYFMEHIEINSAELWLTESSPLKLYSFDMGKGAPRPRAELAIHQKAQEEHKILNGTASLYPLEASKKMKPVIETWSSEDPRVNIDRAFKDSDDMSPDQIEKMKNSSSRAYQLFTRIEQAPNPNSRITLDTERDSLGMPRATLHWELTAFEKRSIRKIYELLGFEAGKAGIGRVKLMDYLQDEKDASWPSFTGGGWHHMGTTRMAEDPKKGVVDANCTVHGIHNLHMTGASCFTTAGAPNPTLSVVALTLRLSDHLKELMKPAGNREE